MMEREVALFEELMRGFPDWLAWRMEAVIVRMDDQRLLSPPVADAWRFDGRR